MVSGFICGTNNLPRDEDDNDDRKTRSADSSPRKSRAKTNKNPYSTRGLDRFSALMSEIEEKRQQIYSQSDPGEISLVRFVYTEDHEFKPIVVKAKSKGNIDAKLEIQPKTTVTQAQKPGLVAVKEVKNDARDEKAVKMRHKTIIYLAMIFISILVVLLAFGRSFAIMCTSIGWYLIPSITNGSCSGSGSNSKNTLKKKDFKMRRLSDKKLMLRAGTMSFKHQ